MKHSFFLVIPKQQQNPRRIKEFEENIFRQWITDLPIGNPSLAARLVYDFIVEFNGLEMPSQLRLDTLELLRPSLFTIEDYLKSKILETDFPKDLTDQKVLKSLVALQRQFTIGYWIVVKELSKQESRWFRSKNLAIAIQRCIKGLSGIIISYYIMGMRVPDWIWMDLHSLYTTSVITKKNAIQVVNWDSNSVKKTSSPEECYLQIMLLTLADYTGLMSREIITSYGFIEAILTFVTISTVPIANQPNQCVIFTEEDKPPFFQNSKMAGSNPVSSTLYLDLTKVSQVPSANRMLVDKNQTRFSAWTQSNPELKAISFELFEYLQHCWITGGAKISEALFSDRLDRYITIGLASAHALQNLQTTDFVEDQEYLAHSLSDQFLSGIFKKKGLLSIGSLITFRKSNAPQHKRALAVVNKLITEKETNRISFGVQLLTHQFLPVSYHALDTHVGEHLKNALIYKDGVQSKKNFIILDNFTFKEGDIIQLLLNHDQFPILLKNKKNIALGYWQFECLKVSMKLDAHS